MLRRNTKERTSFDIFFDSPYYIICGNQCWPRVFGILQAMVFSKDGNRFAWTNGNVVRMVTWHNETKTWQESTIGEGLERTTYMKFSPLGNILATWEVYAKRDGMKPEDMHNLRLWCSVTGKLLQAITQRRSDGWCPQ